MATSAPGGNWLAIGDEIVQALRAGLAGTKPPVHVLTTDDLADVLQEKQLVPAVHVLYRGYSPGKGDGSRSDGTASKTTQTWLVVCVTRHVGGAGAGRRAAGLLAAEVAGLLMGLKCASAAGPLLLAPAPDAGMDNAFQYLPLAFEVAVVMRAASRVAV